MKRMKEYTVAITGASGAVYAVKLIDELLKIGHRVNLILSDSARIVFREELSIDLTDRSRNVADSLLEYCEDKFPKAERKSYKDNLKVHDIKDIANRLSSGSALKKNMIIIPCSMGTLGRVASGISGNLIERSADCVLKEGGNLIMVPRETPFNLIHLENMTRLARAGAVMVPAMPAFYTLPQTIDDMVNFVVGKVMDRLEIEHNLFKRWRSEQNEK